MTERDASEGRWTAAETTISFGEGVVGAVEHDGPAGLSTEDQAAVSALPPTSALLVVQRGPSAGARFLLDAERTVAGRSPDADIFLDDVTVSRRHVEFRRTARSFEVVDTGSLNGTYVNHDRVDSVELKSGNEVQIGKFRLTFYLSPVRTAGTV